MTKNGSALIWRTSSRTFAALCVLRGKKAFKTINRTIHELTRNVTKHGPFRAFSCDFVDRAFSPD